MTEETRTWIDGAAYAAFRAWLRQPAEATSATWNVESETTKDRWRSVVIAIVDELVYAGPPLLEAARRAGFVGMLESEFNQRFQAAILDLAQALRIIDSGGAADNLGANRNKRQFL